jgi:hypothetical protein
MIDNSARTLRHQEQIFDDVMALYVALQSSHSVCVRRAQLNLRGEVPAEPIDFICDVEIKARRAGFYATGSMMDPSLVLTHSLKQAVGKAFLAGGLHIDGPYKTLYFRVKNQADRNSMANNEVALTGATITEAT